MISIAHALFLALLGLTLFLASPAPAVSNRIYRIATVAWVGWSPLHVAQAKGFWDRLGVRVQVVNYQDSITLLEAIKAGKAHMAMDMVGSVLGIYLQGTPAVVLAETDWSHGGDKILVHQGKRMDQLKGQPVGVYLNLPSCLFFLEKYLETQKLTLSQFRIVEMGSEDLTAQFVAGRLPAMVNYEPWVTQALDQTHSTVLASSADFPGCIPEGLWGYRKTISEFPRQDMVAILKGWIQAANWVNDPANWPEYKNILNTATFKDHPPYTDTQLDTMFRNVRIHKTQQLGERNRTGGGLFDYLYELRSFVMTNQISGKDFQPSDLVDNSYVMEALGPAN